MLFRVGIALSLSGLLATGPAQAAVDRYLQAPSSGFAATSAIYNMPADPGFTWSLNQDEEVWAYFKPAAGGRFDRITWYGSDSDGAFAVNFFTTTCVSCGLSPVGTDGDFPNSLLPDPGPFSQASVNKTALAGGMFSYHIDLPSPLSLTAGTMHALSVVNNYSAKPFQWAASNMGPGSHVRYIIGMHMVQLAPGGVAFALTDTMAAVPEPATACTLALGLAVLLWRRRAAAQSGGAPLRSA